MDAEYDTTWHYVYLSFTGGVPAFVSSPLVPDAATKGFNGAIYANTMGVELRDEPSILSFRKGTS